MPAEVVAIQHITLGASEAFKEVVTCPAGKQPIAGGYTVPGGALGSVDVYGNYPQEEGGLFTPQGWVVRGIASPGDGADLTVYAVCVTAS